MAVQTAGILFIISISVITSAFSSSCSYILNQLVYDKENKMRETLRIMSLNRLAYSMSAYFTQGFFALLTSLIIYSAYAVAFRDKEETVNLMGDQQVLLVGVILFGQALIAFSMTMSTIFKPKKYYLRPELQRQ